jgi:hypothetical protein
MDVANYRYRYAYGVSVSITAEGSIGQTDYTVLFTAIITNFVLLGLPIQVVTLVAIYGAGAASTIYKRVQAEKLRVTNLFHGYVLRLLCHSQSFRGLTQTGHFTPATLKEEDMLKLMMESFDCEEQEEEQTGAINSQLGRTLAMGQNLAKGALSAFDIAEKERSKCSLQTVRNLLQVVLAGCDPEGDGSISHTEFICSASGGEALNMREVTDLFNLDRKKGILERMFGDTQFDPSKVRKAVVALQEKTEAKLRKSAWAGTQSWQSGQSLSPAADPESQDGSSSTQLARAEMKALREEQRQEEAQNDNFGRSQTEDRSASTYSAAHEEGCTQDAPARRSSILDEMVINAIDQEVQEALRRNNISERLQVPRGPRAAGSPPPPEIGTAAVVKAF